MRALLIVDLQNGAFDGVRAAPIAHGERLLERVGALLAAARVAGVWVVHVQDCGAPGGAYEQGTPHWRLHPRLAPRPGELVVHKRHASAFHDTELGARLAARAVDELFACGQRSEGCLLQTCLDALALGLPLTLARDAHSTPATNADEVIARVNNDLAARGALLREVQTIATAWRASS